MRDAVHRLRNAEWVRRWGHYWPTFPLLLIAASITPTTGPWLILWFALVLTAGAWAFGPSMIHDHRPCVQCAGSWPMNPAEMAERRRRWLWIAHRGLVLYLGGFLAAWVVVFLFFRGTPLLLVYLLAWYPVQQRSHRLHNQLQPWCPYCKHRRRDDDEDVVVPDPTPSASRS